MMPFPNRHRPHKRSFPSWNDTNQGGLAPTQLAAAQRCFSTLAVLTRTLAKPSSQGTSAVVLALML